MAGAEVVSRAEFARRMEVSGAAVTQAIRRGRLHGDAVLADGKLNLDIAATQWRERAHPKRDLLAEPEAEAEPDDAQPEGSSRYRAAKEREAIARADQIEFNLALSRKEYLPVVDVRRAMVTAGRRIRQQIAAAIGWADELATIPTGDVDGMRAALKDRVRQLQSDAAAAMTAAEDDDDDADDPDGD